MQQISDFWRIVQKQSKTKEENVAWT